MAGFTLANDGFRGRDLPDSGRVSGPSSLWSVIRSVFPVRALDGACRKGDVQHSARRRWPSNPNAVGQKLDRSIAAMRLERSGNGDVGWPHAVREGMPMELTVEELANYGGD